MNHSVVLYSSRYGAAKEYARMLAKSLGCTAYNVKETPLDVAGQARQVILCGGIYAGGLSGVSWLRKNSRIQRYAIREYRKLTNAVHTLARGNTDRGSFT